MPKFLIQGLCVLVSLAPVWAASANPITLNNASFDDFDLFTDLPQPAVFAPIVFGWTEDGPDDLVAVDPTTGQPVTGTLGTGVFVNLPVALGGSADDFIAGVDGSQLAFLSADAGTSPPTAIRQFTAASYTPGQTYTLEVAVGQSNRQPVFNSNPNLPPDPSVGPGRLAVELIYDDGTGTILVAEQTIIAADEIWSRSSPESPFLTPVTVELDVIGGEAWDGTAVGVRLRPIEGIGGNWVLDNVQLSVVPEPGTLGVFGLAGLWMLRRTRQRAKG